MTRAKSHDEAQRTEMLDIVGADANNLKNVDVHIPLDRVTVVTGVSGSGKSSLLADTLAVEADRRMQLFLGIHQPHIEGTPPRAFIGPIPPAIHVGQRTFRASVRTTIATATGLLTTLRRLFLAHSQPYSEELRRFVPAPSPASYAAWLAKHYKGRATIWAAPIRFVATDGMRCAERLRENGIHEVVVRSETDTAKAWEQGHTVPLAKFKPLRPTVKHIIEAQVGSIEVSPKKDPRKIQALLEQAFAAGNGQVVVELPEATQAALIGPFGPRLDSTLHHVDPDSPMCFLRPSAHLLSFNAPDHPESGACKTCLGLGRATTLDERALVSHPERSMHEGAFSVWAEKNYRYVNIQHETIEGLRGMHGFSPDTSWYNLPEGARQLVLDGAGQELVTDRQPKTGRKMSAPRAFEGFRRAVLDRVARGTKVSESLAFLVSEGSCPDCAGTRWSDQARALRIDGVGIHHLLAKPFVDFVAFTEETSPFARALPTEASALVRLLHHNASAFVSVGLGHLTGDRGMLDVSEGESRRARLAAVLNSRNAGLCMLLDEPARGLHDEDVQNMADAITDLARMHTVVMNEHRHALARAADHVIELGPGAGKAGGEVVYSGPVAQSSWAKAPFIQRARMATSPSSLFLTIRGATIHNVERVDCAIPLGRLTCITGLSGSGKSNFVRGVLVPAVARALPHDAEIGNFDERRGTWTSIHGVEHLKGMIALDQKAPSPNRRSIVATFLDVADVIRAAFGSSDQARRAALSPTDFGLNAGSGRCQLCLGVGEVAEHDQWATCPVCGGTRYGQEALSVRVDGVSIGELLDVPVAELRTRVPSFLSAYLPILAAMVDLGIGHIALGRRVDTLSGGEIQRLRIATKLAEHGAGKLLIVLDEPAAGLHPSDVELLVRALDRILDQGRNTVVLVEHNAAIIQACDWLVEFGPGSGPHGGRIVAAGSPEEVSRTDTATGRVLSGHLAPPHVRPLPRRLVRPSDEPDEPAKQAERVTAWMRHLVGDNVAPPEAAPNDATPDRPIAAVSAQFWHGRRAYEVGDLDLEIGKLLLDLRTHHTSFHDLDKLAQIWAKEIDSQLAIHPFLKDIQVWGPRLPASVIKTAHEHVQAMGLELVDAFEGHTRDATVLDARATGDRFVPRQGSSEERRRLLMDALALGGGHVELRGHRGELRRRIGPRLLDLKIGIVGPMAAAPFHFSRHDHRGQCSMCKGSGHVMTLQADLVIRNERVSPENDDFLHPAAANVMKGVRRSELLPFLRRMADEGLWQRSASYKDLDQRSREMLLFGCWTRPGHGTFLKGSNEDPSEVGAWLRWDGLFHALRSQLHRSTDVRWKTAIEQSLSERSCPSCDGTGLALCAKLLQLAGRPLHDWIREGTAGDFHDALKELRTSSTRQKHALQRILACLAPIAKHARSQPLRAPVERELAHKISRHVVETFTTMPVVFT